MLKDIKFPVMLDMFDMCSKDLQEKLRPARTQFKDYEDWLVDQVDMTGGYLFSVNPLVSPGHPGEGQEQDRGGEG